jgi:hypothetical protein
MGADCGPERVTVRSSYRKITEESDFIARDFSEYDMNRFGFFTTTPVRVRPPLRVCRRLQGTGRAV